MEGKNIPLIIMLLAGSVISVACIIFRIPLLQTLLYVFLTLVVFYLLGLVIKKIIVSINKEAEERAALLKQEEQADEQESEEEKENSENAENEESVKQETEEDKSDGFTIS